MAPTAGVVHQYHQRHGGAAKNIEGIITFFQGKIIKGRKSVNPLTLCLTI
jgi:hypothetical protein